MLLHPVVAARSCEDCAKWWYDDGDRNQSGNFVFRNEILKRGDKTPLKRSVSPDTKTRKTPCEHCPKKSPEHAKTMVLSDRNEQAIAFYHRTTACYGANLTARMKADETLMQNLVTIDQLFKQHDRQSQNQMLLSLMTAAVPK